MNPEIRNQNEENQNLTQTNSEAANAYGENKLINQQPNSGEDYVELKYRSTEYVATAKLAKGLGLFSIALGLMEVLAPGPVGELIGVGDQHRRLLPALGLREIAHGVGILRQTKPTTAVWTRVAGDAIDLAFLGAAFASDETNKKRLTGATLAVLGVAALDVLCAQQLSNQNWRENDANGITPTTVGQSSGRQTTNA